jgi:hypothetical protein
LPRAKVYNPELLTLVGDEARGRDRAEDGGPYVGTIFEK